MAPANLTKEDVASTSHTVKTNPATRSRKLDRQEVHNLLSGLGNGQSVSEDELDYVFKIADANGDKSISPAELSTLLGCWDNYQNSRAVIDGHFRKYDANGDDRLDEKELRQLLADTSGRHVSFSEVKSVMGKADVLGNGVITKPELRRVLALWESRIQADQKICCTVQ